MNAASCSAMGSTRRSSQFTPGRRTSTNTGSTNSELRLQQSDSTVPGFWALNSPELQPCHYGYDYDDEHVDSAGESMLTYTSTDESESEDEDEEPPVEVAPTRREPRPAKVVPTSPPSFGSLWPSTRRLNIQHDDSSDGNMNLRIDTLVPKRGREDVQVILFHLRMYDLYHRKFSLRRYCRSSGREVCHSERVEDNSRSSRRVEGPYNHKPSHHFSLTLRGIRTKEDTGDSSHHVGTEELRRHVSAPHRLTARPPESRESSPDSLPMGRSQMTNVIKLEFSNYAHVEITRRGRESSVHYDFEYWGINYQWKKTARRKSGQEDVAYCLYASKRSSHIASIDFAPLTPAESAAEEKKGGWVMPCSIRINDRHVFQNADDVADVIVATGLMALVDDSIRHHWPQESPTGSSASITDTVTKALEKILHIHPHIHDIKNRRRHQKATRDNALRRFASHG